MIRSRIKVADHLQKKKKKEERKIKKTSAISTNKLITYKISPQPNVLSYLTLVSIQTTVDWSFDNTDSKCLQRTSYFLGPGC